MSAGIKVGHAPKTTSHKRKPRRLIIMTTDCPEFKTRELHFSMFPIVMLVILAVVSILGVAVMARREVLSQDREARVAADYEATIASIQADNADLAQQLDERDAKIEALSAAAVTNSETATALQEELEQQRIPTRLPLSGPGTPQEYTDGDRPYVVFTASEGVNVVATASGTVTAVDPDDTYGYCVLIDHGNGYRSVYFNRGIPQVKPGDEVAGGNTLYIIGTENIQLVYQILNGDNYINPMDLINING